MQNLYEHDITAIVSVLQHFHEGKAVLWIYYNKSLMLHKFIFLVVDSTCFQFSSF